jgi:antibiotic biosynthesis monooxygenase (ABM) superfamily enzyme
VEGKSGPFLYNHGGWFLTEKDGKTTAKYVVNVCLFYLIFLVVIILNLTFSKVPQQFGLKIRIHFF